MMQNPEVQELIAELENESPDDELTRAYKMLAIVKNEDEIAKMIFKNRDDCHYVEEYKRWLTYDYDKLRYVLTKNNKIIRMVAKEVEKLRCQTEALMEELRTSQKYRAEKETKELYKLLNFFEKLGNNNKLESICKLGQSIRSISAAELNQNRGYITVKNGILNLRTGELITDTEECIRQKDTYQAPVCFDISKNNCEWHVFLNDTFRDESLRRYIQVYFGSLLLGNPVEQVMHFLHGHGGEGKGVFLDTIRACFGDYAASMRTEAINDCRFESSNAATPEIAKLPGKRLVTASEGKERAVLNLALVKQITGQNTVSARPNYGDPFEFKFSCGLVVETNFLPQIKENDFATWRRIRVIPFLHRVKPEKIDKHLREKLLRELDGIFKWLVEGAQLYLKEGLPKCSLITEATEEYRNDSDPLTAFITGYIKPQSGGKVKMLDLFSKYCEYCRDNYHWHVSMKRFSRELENRGFEKRRYSEGVMVIGVKKDYSFFNPACVD